MKNLAHWIRTLAVVSVAAFGVAACDSGNQTETTGTSGAQDEGVYSDETTTQEQDTGMTTQGGSTTEEQGTGQYGQESDTGVGQQNNTGMGQDSTQTNDSEFGETDNGTMTQGN